MKKIGLNGYVYEFDVDYSNNDTKDAIPYVHKYLMSKYVIVWMQIFRLIKKVFFLALTILSNFTNALDWLSIKNQECKVRSEIINVSSNNPIFNPFKINKCSGNCDNINTPYAKICVPDVIQDLNVKF